VENPWLSCVFLEKWSTFIVVSPSMLVHQNVNIDWELCLFIVYKNHWKKYRNAHIKMPYSWVLYP
jgi:hypothetical protein